MNETCRGCGRAIEGGTESCRATFDLLVGRDFGDARFFAVHRLFVDVYALQHPDEFCASAKSLAAHLAGLCLILEHGASPASGDAELRRWLDGPSGLAKPELPAERGAITLANLEGIDDPIAWREAVGGWADSVWHAYADLHSPARAWAREATGRRVAKS
jgi:hypothetical protein